MKKTKKYFFILTAAILFGLLIAPSITSAVTISPPIIELDAARGDVINQTLKVRNESSTSMTYYLSAERFIAGGEEGAPEFVGEDIGLATWIKFPFNSINIGPGETVEVPFQIVIPSYASPGGNYAAVFLSTVPPEAEQGASQVSIASRIGTLILVRIAGEVNEDAKIADFSTGADSYLSLPVDFNIRVENDGNVHVKPMGSITIKNMLGSVAGNVQVNEKGGNVLPEQIRKFESSWIKNPNATDANTFWGKYMQEKENYAFGRYTAELVLNYGTAGKLMTASTSFWVIPWHIIIVNLLILIILVVIIYFLVKKYNAWLIKKYAPKGSKKK